MGFSALTDTLVSNFVVRIPSGLTNVEGSVWRYRRALPESCGKERAFIDVAVEDMEYSA